MRHHFPKNRYEVVKMQRIEINHSVKTIQLNSSSAFSSAAKNTLLQSEIIDNTNNSSSGDISLPITATSATVQTPVSVLLLSATNYFYLRLTINGVVLPIMRTKSFQYHNSVEPITAVELWNGTLTLTGTTFTVPGSVLAQTINHVALN